jgi:hypothetical protein
VNTSLRPAEIEIARHSSQRQGRPFEQLASVACSHSNFRAAPHFKVPGAFYCGMTKGAQWLTKAQHPRLARLPQHTPSTHAQIGLHFSVLPTQIAAGQFTCPGSSHRKRGLRRSSKKVQWVGAPKACCLTLRSRGRPNGMAHWPSSAGACAPFCTCCPVRHAVGLPLNSNVRQHKSLLRPSVVFRPLPL